MAHCTNCGTQIGEGIRFCPSCGTTCAQSGAVAGPPETADAQNNKAMGVLAYLGILVLVPVFAARESKFARFHANQGLVLLLAEVAFGIVSAILTSIFTALLLGSGAWGLWSAITTILGLLWLVFLVLAIIGIVNAVNGRCKPLPVIGGIVLLK